MRSYEIKYKDGQVKKIDVPDKKTLIEELFDGSEEDFKARVDKLQWRTPSLFFTEDVSTGEVTSQMATADTNPYGWRNEAND